jgi:hypothetical protein
MAENNPAEVEFRCFTGYVQEVLSRNTCHLWIKDTPNALKYDKNYAFKLDLSKYPEAGSYFTLEEAKAIQCQRHIYTAIGQSAFEQGGNYVGRIYLSTIFLDTLGDKVPPFPPQAHKMNGRNDPGPIADEFKTYVYGDGRRYVGFYAEVVEVTDDRCKMNVFHSGDNSSVAREFKLKDFNERINFKKTTLTAKKGATGALYLTHSEAFETEERLQLRLPKLPPGQKDTMVASNTELSMS